MSTLDEATRLQFGRSEQANESVECPQDGVAVSEIVGRYYDTNDKLVGWSYYHEGHTFAVAKDGNK